MSRSKIRAIYSSLLPIFLAITAFSFAPVYAADVNSTWDGSTDSWTSSHWSSPLFPNNGHGGFTYDAAIDNGTVTLDQNIVIEGLALSGGSLTATSPFTLTLNGPSVWSGGTMRGTGQTVIAPGGTLLISGSNNHHLERTLVNDGATTWTGFNNLILKDGTFQNNGTLTADVSTPAVDSFGEGGTNVFNNAGTFIKQGAGRTSFTNLLGLGGVTFNNTGSVDVREGLLVLGSGGNHTGDFTGLDAGTLEFRENHTFAVGSDITGGVNVEFASGTNNYNGSINTTGDLNVSGGEMTVNGSVSSASLNVGGGVNVVVNGSLTWDRGTMSSGGQTTVNLGGTLSMVGEDGMGGANPHILNRTLSNNGTIQLTGQQDLALRDGLIQNNGEFTIENELLFDIYGIGGNNGLHNAGTITKLGSRTARIGAITESMQELWPEITRVGFTNTGRVDVQAGRLEIYELIGQQTGEFEIAAGAELQFGGGEFGSTSNIHGLGNVEFFASTATILGDIDVGLLRLVNGAVLDMQVDGRADRMELFEGSIVGPGGLTITSKIAFHGSIIMHSNVVVEEGATITTLSPGALILKPSITISGSGSTLENLGEIRRLDGGVSELAINVKNHGKIEIGAGNKLIISNKFEQVSGVIDVDGELSLKETQIDGGRITGGGKIVILPPTNGGAQKPGSLSIPHVEVSPGNSPGTLTIEGDVVFGATSVLDIEIAGTEQGSTYDLLSVAGDVDADGILRVTLLDHFAPEIGDSYEVLTSSALHGQFTSLDLPGLAAGHYWDVRYEVDSLSLAVVTATEIGDYNLDGAVDAADYTVWRNAYGQHVSTGQLADGDRSGIIDDADYVVWKRHFGLSTVIGSGAHSVVPEPSTAAMAMLVFGLMAVRRRKR